jgi:hypothetical protein
MGDTATLVGIKAITNDVLYIRLANHILCFPNPHPVEDYVYRCDVWEMVNKALQAEIGRRRATPPSWWPAREKPPAPRRRHLMAVGIYAGVLALAAAAGAMIGH